MKTHLGQHPSKYQPQWQDWKSLCFAWLQLRSAGFKLFVGVFLVFFLALLLEDACFQLRGISVRSELMAVSCAPGPGLPGVKSGGCRPLIDNTHLLTVASVAFSWSYQNKLSVAVKTQRPCRRSCFCVIWVTLACRPWQRHRLPGLSLSLLLFSVGIKAAAAALTLVKLIFFFYFSLPRSFSLWRQVVLPHEDSRLTALQQSSE